MSICTPASNSNSYTLHPLLRSHIILVCWLGFHFQLFIRQPPFFLTWYGPFPLSLVGCVVWSRSGTVGLFGDAGNTCSSPEDKSFSTPNTSPRVSGVGFRSDSWKWCKKIGSDNYYRFRCGDEWFGWTWFQWRGCVESKSLRKFCSFGCYDWCCRFWCWWKSEVE